jgi:D-threo-aldose 1-dehydrogenase
MDPFARQQVGGSSVEVPQLGFGGAHLGELYGLVSEVHAQETLGAAWREGIRYYDTAPWYGRGQSEHRCGYFLRQHPREDFVLSTKAGRILTVPRDSATFDRSPWVGGLPFHARFDYSYDGIMRAYEDSRQRMGIGRIDLALIHDLDLVHHERESRLQGYVDQLDAGNGWHALRELRDNGDVGAIGFGINTTNLVLRWLELFDPDCFLVAMPYTLLDQSALEVELPACSARGVSVIVGAPFASGVLATGSHRGAKYNYNDAGGDILDRTSRIAAVCASHDVPLAAAALQFPLGHEAVVAVIPGAVDAKQVEENVANFARSIPAAVWSDLKGEGLIASDAPVPPS